MANNVKSADKGGMNYYLRITLSLVITAAAAALMLSVVNLITEGRIEKNRQHELISAINSIFPNAGGYEELDADFEAPVKTVYSVGDGWCVVTAPKGFAGEVELMVGITSSGEVAGISILDSSETPGIGSKIEGEYLNSFKGSKGSLIPGANVDTISGATYSSKAVIEGVNSALSAVKSLTFAETEADTEADTEAEEDIPGYAEAPNEEASETAEINQTETTEITTEAAE